MGAALAAASISTDSLSPQTQHEAPFRVRPRYILNGPVTRKYYGDKVLYQSRIIMRAISGEVCVMCEQGGQEALIEARVNLGKGFVYTLARAEECRKLLRAAYKAQHTSN